MEIERRAFLYHFVLYFSLSAFRGVIVCLVCFVSFGWFHGQLMTFEKHMFPELHFADCGPPSSIIDGTVQYNSTAYLAVAKYTCDEGFDLPGNHVVTCLANSTWEHSATGCKIKGIRMNKWDCSMFTKTEVSLEILQIYIVVFAYTVQYHTISHYIYITFHLSRDKN